MAPFVADLAGLRSEPGSGPAESEPRNGAGASPRSKPSRPAALARPGLTRACASPRGRLRDSCALTNAQAAIRIEGPVLAIHQGDATLDAIDTWNKGTWNKGTHGRSGVIDRVQAAGMGAAHVQAQAQVTERLAQQVPPGRSSVCGNSICQNSRFLANHLLALEACCAQQLHVGAGTHRDSRRARVDRRGLQYRQRLLAV